MKYFYLADDGKKIPLANFTLTPPQEEYKVQTYIDRTDEYATGRILPGTFSWNRAEGEPEVGSGEIFTAIDEDGTAYRCKTANTIGVCTGSVLDSSNKSDEKKCS